MKDFKDYLEKDYELVWLDYRDSLDENPELVEKVARAGDLTPLYEDRILESIDEERWESASEEARNVVKKMIEDGAPEEEANEMMDEIIYEIEDRDKSNPYMELVKRTKVTFFISLGMGISEAWSKSDEELDEEVEQAMEFFETDNEDTKKGLSELFGEAGGILRIYFTASLDELLDENIKSIHLDGIVSVGVINPYEGSGYVNDVEFDNVKIPFKRENLFVDRAEKWGWAEMSGCYDGWAEPVGFLEEENGKELEESPEAGIKERENEYNKRFKEGGCTFGDIDMKRHRHVEYINEYPCGWKCKDCGTLWID